MTAKLACSPNYEGAGSEYRHAQLGKVHGEGVDVPGGVAEETVKPAPVSVAHMAAGEDDLGHVAMTLGENPARDDNRTGVKGRGSEDGFELL